MKQLPLFCAMLWPGFLMAQEPATTPTDRSEGFFQQKLLSQAEPAGKVFSGTVYLLQQDRMPCLVADSARFAGMPNAFNGSANIENFPIPYFYQPTIPEPGALSVVPAHRYKKAFFFERPVPFSTEEFERKLKQKKSLSPKIPESIRSWNLGR